MSTEMDALWLDAAQNELARLRAELETERMRVVACGVVATADTPDSAATARNMHADYRTASCYDVARRVDECIRLRAENEALRVDAERWRYFVTNCEWLRHHDDDGSYSSMATRLPYEADQSCVATRNAAIDAAHAALKETQR